MSTTTYSTYLYGYCSTVPVGYCVRGSLRLGVGVIARRADERLTDGDSERLSA